MICDLISKIVSTCQKFQTCYNIEMKMVEAISGITRTYTFVFDPDPEGCPCRNSDPNIVMVQSAENWIGMNASNDVNGPR